MKSRFNKIKFFETAKLSKYHDIELQSLGTFASNFRALQTAVVVSTYWEVKEATRSAVGRICPASHRLIGTESKPSPLDSQNLALKLIQITTPLIET
jgi:hypothetical protein